MLDALVCHTFILWSVAVSSGLKVLYKSVIIIIIIDTTNKYANKH